MKRLSGLIILVVLLLAACGGGAPSVPPVTATPPSHADILITIGPPAGTIKPLLGVNVGPIPAGESGNADVTDGYRLIGVRLIRTHDYYGPLDMATIYPDQNGDPSDPASYDFAASDEVFAAILAGGFEPYLRLGDSWNNAPTFPAADPRRPTNPENWTRAAVEVVRHYNDPALWGDSHLHYVEIWNEPDNKQFWDGGRLEFFELFAETASALKAAFPDLSIGGPGLLPSAFKLPEGQEYTEAFLNYLQGHNVPLDFLSWHMYSNDPADFANAAVYFRGQLDSRGYEAAESHITEWNTTFSEREGEDDPALRVGAKGAALMTAAWIGLQEQGVDGSLFYRGMDSSVDHPTFYGLFFADGRPKRTAWAFRLWSRMTTLSQRLDLDVIPTHESQGVTLWVLAGQDHMGQVALLIANPSETATTWRLVFADDRMSPDYYALSVQEVSDHDEGIKSVPLEGAVAEIGAHTVQLVFLSPLEI